MPSVPRFFCAQALASGTRLQLPAVPSRHVQVLRMQPGDTIRIFDDSALGGEFEATISSMGRRHVEVLVGRHDPVHRENRRSVQLAIGMPANERMDWLVEKATELGVYAIQPLMTQHSVVRLRDERASKRAMHWRGIAIAACEQCGRNRLPVIAQPLTLGAWSTQLPAGRGTAGRLLLSLAPGATPLADWLARAQPPEQGIVLLSGPEGGLSAAEEAAALTLGFDPVSLGSRVLRSETAALVALTLLA